MRRISIGPLMVLAAASLWGTTGPATVRAGAPLTAASLGGWRLLVGGCALVLWAAARGNPLRGLRRRAVWPWIIAAAIATGVFQAAYLAAVDRSGAALATVVALGVAPVATGVLARWWLGDRLGRGWLPAGGLSVLGCAVLVGPGSGGVLTPAGVGLAVIAGACYGAYTVAAKRLAHEDVDPSGVTALTLLLGALMLAPAMVGDAHAATAASSVVLIAWVGLVTTGAAYWLFVRGLRTTSAGTAGVLSLAEPLVAAGLGLAALGEHLTAPQVCGAVLLVAGLVAAVRGERPIPDAVDVSCSPGYLSGG